MFTIATATVSFSEVGFWLGALLWTLFLWSVSGITLYALRRDLTKPYARSAPNREATTYQHAA